MESPIPTDEPPAYTWPSLFIDSDDDIVCSIPPYSPTACNNEEVEFIDGILSEVGVGPHCRDLVYNTANMRVNLGRRLLNLRTPAYGLGAIRGYIQLSGKQTLVESVTATIKGYITITSTERGVIQDVERQCVLCTTLQIYPPPPGGTFLWNDKQPFSMPIPEFVPATWRTANAVASASSSETSSVESGTGLGPKMVPLPPSHVAQMQDTTTVIMYALRIDMKRKGLRPHQSLFIPFQYLPKSSPLGAPLGGELPPFSRTEPHSPYPANSLTMRTSKIDICASSKDKKAVTATGNNAARAPSAHANLSVSISLPTSSIASGSTFPALITLCSQAPSSSSSSLSQDQQPLLSIENLFDLATHLRVDLTRTTKLWRNSGRELIWTRRSISVADARIVVDPSSPSSSADGYESRNGDDRDNNDDDDGRSRQQTRARNVVRLLCTIDAGEAGHERSWGIEGMIKVEYHVRVMFIPSSSSSLPLIDSVPAFRHDEPIELTTDAFGTLERELLTTRGVSLPALGILRGVGI